MRDLVERLTRPCYLIGVALSAIPLLAFPSVYGGYSLPKAVALQLLTVLILSVWAFRALSPIGRHSESNGSLRRAPGLEYLFEILRSPLAIAGLAFVVSQLLATIFSLSPSISFWGGHERWVGTVANLCGFVILLAVPLACRSRRDVRGMASVVLLGSSIVAEIGISQHIWRSFPIPAWAYPRVGSTLGNPIFLGAYLVLVIPLAAGRWIESVRRLRVGPSSSDVCDILLYTLLLAGQLVCLFLTGSRGPWLGAACAALAFCAILAWRRNRPRLLVAALAIFIGVALLLLLLNLPKTPLQALLDLPYVSRLRLVRDSGSVSERILVWQGAWELIHERPAIGGALDHAGWLRHVVGYGPETTQYTFWTAYPMDLFHHATNTAFLDRLHNRLLEVTLTSGVLGLVTYLGYLVALGLCLLRQVNRARSLKDLLLPVALLSAIIGHFVQLQTGIEEIETLTLLWLYGGLALALAIQVPEVAESPAVEESKAIASESLQRGRNQVSPTLTGLVAQQDLGLGDVCTADRHKNLSSLPRGKALAYSTLAALIGLVLVGAVALRGGREIAAASLYVESQDPRLPISDSQRFDALTSSIRLAPREPLYYTGKADLNFRIAQSVPDDEPLVKTKMLQCAVEAAEQAIRLIPYERSHHVTRAAIYGYWAKTTDPSAIDPAVESWQRAIELSPRDADIRASLGLLYLETGYTAEALRVIEEAIKLDPRNGESYYVLGLLYRELGQEELAQEQFKIGYSVDSGCSECEAELMSPHR